jgi:hypothetical protein
MGGEAGPFAMFQVQQQLYVMDPGTSTSKINPAATAAKFHSWS